MARQQFASAPDTVKYAVFSQVDGEWRFEGFVHSEHADDTERTIADMKAVCEKENGLDSFRTHAFLDQPHKKPVTEEDQAERNATASVLLEEKMG